MLMGLAVNLLAAALLAFTILFYAVVYTMWLKRATPQNIVIGGFAGALPPAVGWAAASGTAPLNAWLLVAIIFFWTPPHFWALSLTTQDDYASAGVPMLPVAHGEPTTRRQILIYSLMLVPLAADAGASPALAARSTWPSPRSAARGSSASPRGCWCARTALTPSGCSGSRSSTFSCCSPPCWASMSPASGAGAAAMSDPRGRVRRGAPGAQRPKLGDRPRSPGLRRHRFLRHHRPACWQCRRAPPLLTR